MTFRAFLLGLFGVGVVCGFTYFNDGVLRQTMFVCNHMPTSVYGGLLLFLLLVNPVLNQITRRTGGRCRWLKPFSAKELALVVALVLPVCCIPYSSMFRLLPRVAMLPHHYVKTQVHWRWRDEATKKEHTVLEYAPKKMLADVSEDENRALTGYTQGLRYGSEAISFRDIPWHAWGRTLAFWLPLFGVLWVALTGLAIAVHPQWADHEHLPYPIVQFTRAILPAKGGVASHILKNRLFWLAAGIVICIHLNNFLYVYHPDKIIPVARTFNFRPLARLFPTFMRGGGWSLINLRFYFAAIGIAYLLATDVSLSVGIGPFISKYAAGLLAGYGISMGAGTAFTPRIDKSLVFGGFVGMFLFVLYSGRHYFLNLGKRAFGLRSEENFRPSAIWGARAFFAGFAVFALNLYLVGLDWQLALLYSSLTFIIFFVMGRIIAETGLFYMCPAIYPGALLLSFFGEQALGPSTLMIMFLLTCMMLVDPRETFMPYIVNSIHLAESSKLKPGRTGMLVMVALLVGLAIAAPVTLYFNYDRGVNWNDGYGTKTVPRWAGDGALKARTRLLAQDKLEHAESISGWRRFPEMKPHKHSVIAFGVAMLGVLLFAAARLRWAKWPLHPVMFLVWSGYSGYMIAWSFLAGCFLKFIVTRYGGARAYQQVKPLMFGLIAGDMLSGILVIAIGVIYNLVTGELPKTYWVLPG